MNDSMDNPGNTGEMSEYLQLFVDETDEQLDDLVETMLILEKDPADSESLNEAFRLVHSIKGSAGMMGFDSIMVLTHHLESQFEKYRSGVARLDEPAMNLVLQCIDYLRQSNERLCKAESLVSPAELLEQLDQLQIPAIEPAAQQLDETVDEAQEQSGPEEDSHNDADRTSHGLIRLAVRFRDGLQLPDLKARLIVARLSRLCDVKATRPDLDSLADDCELREFEVDLESGEDPDRLLAVANVDGVAAIEVVEHREAEEAPDLASTPATSDASDASEPAAENVEPGQVSTSSPALERSEDEPRQTAAPERPATPSTAEEKNTRVVETMRVDIDRLDNLMNLTGQLVVNRARLMQISGQISPELRKASMLSRIRDFSDSLLRTIDALENSASRNDDWSTQINQLRAGLELLEEQAEVWENGRYCVGQIGEAIDQLSRVSHGLQQGVLDIRMVPVGPLFNRFKRVVRDLSKEGGKKVNLVIRGEKTELDKRMIDELGDPLVHLIRNSIDHGLEPPQIRLERGKPEIGTIRLEASHTGNTVTIQIRDDGGGIDIAKIKARLISRSLVTTAVAESLSDEQALEYIWDPGFSTASEVTDVSGRGVGMDVVRTRINDLNGTIDVITIPEQGTTFTIRLPLTLAIINSLLVRLRGVVFSIPVDSVREIVSVKSRAVVTVNGKQTFDVRDEYIPLISLDDVFHWHDVDYGHTPRNQSITTESGTTLLEVVILHVAGKVVGLRVDELLGNQDIVIKSLSDNFVHVEGLSGASILGDGSVCLMLDVNAVIAMATRSSAKGEPPA